MRPRPARQTKAERDAYERLAMPLRFKTRDEYDAYLAERAELRALNVPAHSVEAISGERVEEPIINNGENDA